MSTLLEQYTQALQEFDARMALVGADQWTAPTPCSDWDVRALVAHVVDEQRWVPYLLGGGSVADAGDRFADDPLHEDAQGAWSRASGAAREAFAADGALDQHVSLSYGDTSARDYLWEMTVDAAIHAWDLARGIGADDRLDAELVRRIHQAAEKDSERIAASGFYGTPIAVASGADLQTRMLGLYGRRG
jgi:uncharacterized protein (TIGR03086 family)